MYFSCMLLTHLIVSSQSERNTEENQKALNTCDKQNENDDMLLLNSNVTTSGTMSLSKGCKREKAAETTANMDCNNEYDSVSCVEESTKPIACELVQNMLKQVIKKIDSHVKNQFGKQLEYFLGTADFYKQITEAIKEAIGESRCSISEFIRSLGLFNNKKVAKTELVKKSKHDERGKREEEKGKTTQQPSIDCAKALTTEIITLIRKNYDGSEEKAEKLYRQYLIDKVIDYICGNHIFNHGKYMAKKIFRKIEVVVYNIVLQEMSNSEKLSTETDCEQAKTDHYENIVLDEKVYAESTSSTSCESDASLED